MQKSIAVCSHNDFATHSININNKELIDHNFDMFNHVANTTHVHR